MGLGIVLMDCASVPFTTFDFPLNGLVTVTNVYAGRSAAWFQELSTLYEVADHHDVDSIASAIAKAAHRLRTSLNAERRQYLAGVLRAKIPRTWHDSFAAVDDDLQRMGIPLPAYPRATEL